MNRRLVESVCEQVFPFQALLGVGGNLLNLMVLLSRPMRSRTNTLLAFAAISDILFLLAMIPNNLSRRQNWVYQQCSENEGGNQTRLSCNTAFARFYIAHKSLFAFLLNWFSGASSWLMVAVSFDRLWAIKSPFAARNNSCSLRECISVPLIFAFNALITMHMNFPTATKGTEDPRSLFFVLLVLINVFAQILIPMALLIVFNAFLIYYLRNRRQFLMESAGAVRERVRSSDETPPLLDTATRKSTTVSRNGSNNSTSGWGRQLGKAERHVTVTVAAIVTANVMTHLPSAVLYGCMYIFYPTSISDRRWYTWIALSSSIVITGKVANFFLFCMSSKHFRQQMRKKICCCPFLARYRSNYKDSAAIRTRSVPLNLIGDSNSNVPLA